MNLKKSGDQSNLLNLQNYFKKYRNDFMKMVFGIILIEVCLILMSTFNILPKYNGHWIFLGTIIAVFGILFYIIARIREWKLSREIHQGKIWTKYPKTKLKFILSPWWVFVLVFLFVTGLKWFGYIANSGTIPLVNEIVSGGVLYGLFLIAYILDRNRVWRRIDEARKVKNNI